jgi:hypothetical protein
VPAIESGLGTFRGAVRVYPTPDDRANRFELRVLDTDPHADAIPWPGPSVTSVTQPAELGPFEDAMPCRVLFLRNLTACPDVIIWAIDLKRGMELGPWTECIDRLATTREQAAAVLRDVVAVLEGRAEYLASAGQRIWEPTPEMPTLVIVIDEYAELTEEASEAMHYTDTIARLGRAEAVTLIAATQRPTQKVMGQGAVRSQMDLRICVRVREHRDVDLVLGRGMPKAGRNAHQLNAPEKVLLITWPLFTDLVTQLQSRPPQQLRRRASLSACFHAVVADRRPGCDVFSRVCLSLVPCRADRRPYRRGWGREVRGGAVDDVAGDVGEALVGVAGVLAQQREGLAHVQGEALGDPALGLLDDDPAV